jgi:UrcA family protein
MPRPTIRSMKNTLAFVLLTAAVPALSQAAGEPAVPTYQVNFGDLNLNSAAGTELIYRRIRWGAGIVCRHLEGREIAKQAAHQRCEKEAIGRAVAQVGHPRLTAYYSKLNHGKLPSAAFDPKSSEGLVRVVAGH